MNINIRTLTGQIHKISVKATDTVNDLKLIIEQKYGIPMEKFVLTTSGKHLLNNTLLSTYNLSENSTIYLVYRTNGG